MVDLSVKMRRETLGKVGEREKKIWWGERENNNNNLNEMEKK
jgi:hypothetical protein